MVCREHALVLGSQNARTFALKALLLLLLLGGWPLELALVLGLHIVGRLGSSRVRIGVGVPRGGRCGEGVAR